ncbi:MAG: transposase, partial [Dichotomicrobium sp.]
MAGFRCDSKRLSKPVWRFACGHRPPGGSITAIIAPFMPRPARTGRPRAWRMRDIINAIFYVLRAGCPWRMLP